MVHNLLDLPHEVLHGIIIRVNPQDVASLCCCRTLNDYIKNNRLLFKELYLAQFDAPTFDITNTDFAWDTELCKLVKAQKILESEHASFKLEFFDLVSQSIFHLLKTAAVGSTPSSNIPYLTTLFENQLNPETLLCRSFLYDWVKFETWSKNRRLSNLPREEGKASTTDTPSKPPTRRGDEPAETFSLRQLVLTGMQARSTNVLRPVVPNTQPGPEEARIRQISAKLHCLYGAPVSYARNDKGKNSRYSLRSDTTDVHPFARSLVYDLRQRTEKNFWGPFMDDGSQDVDWEKLEAIMIVLGYNISHYASTCEMHETLIPAWETPFEGATPYSLESRPHRIPKDLKPPLQAQDPYNITGTWMRVVCFLDYTELFSFNFSSEQNDLQPRPPLDSEEAFRLIVCRLRVTKIEAPGKDEGKGLPVVWFVGKSSSLRPSLDPNANAKIRGVVRLTPQGEVRWTTWSIFHGEERWRSEGIQIGGVQSARGVLGTWFDKDFDEHGPAGPTCFWKHDTLELCKGWTEPAAVDASTP